MTHLVQKDERKECSRTEELSVHKFYQALPSKNKNFGRKYLYEKKRALEK